MVAYCCILLHIVAYCCIWLHIVAYGCIRLHIASNGYIWLHIIAYCCILVHMAEYCWIWAHIVAFDCILIGVGIIFIAHRGRYSSPLRLHIVAFAAYGYIWLHICVSQNDVIVVRRCVEILRRARLQGLLDRKRSFDVGSDSHCAAQRLGSRITDTIFKCIVSYQIVLLLSV